MTGLVLFCFVCLVYSLPCCRSAPRTHHVLQVKSLLPSAACSSATLANTRTTTTGGMRISHRHGPCTPNQAEQTNLTQFFLQDEGRANFIRRRRRIKAAVLGPSSTQSFTNIPARAGSSFGTGNYVVTIGLGTPKRDLTVVFDTGSDVTWVQCQPCVTQCYSQREPIFDPTRSSTYANVSCHSPYCAALRSATGKRGGCSDSNCVYGVQYGDGSYSVGFFAKETLTLSSRKVIPRFFFGCGERNDGLFGETAGLLGLGRNRLSLVSQTAREYKKVFSYCLPSTSGSTGHLNFGRDYTRTSFATFRSTPMLVDRTMPTFYFLDLVGIRVGGRRMRISSAVFRRVGTLIDSGTVITRLPPKAYRALRTAFRRGMSKYPRTAALSLLDTCYDLSSYDRVAIPTVELLFRGRTSLKVDASGIIFVHSRSKVCLAFAGNDDPRDMGIIGNMQQRTFEVVYDGAMGWIGFGAGGCS